MVLAPVETFLRRLKTLVSPAVLWSVLPGTVRLPSGRLAEHGSAVPLRLCSLLVIFVTGCGGEPPPQPSVASSSKVLPVLKAETVSVGQNAWPTMIRSHGSLMADEEAVVGSRVEGRVDAVQVDLGDRVVAGAVVVAIGQAEFRLKVQQAEAQLLQTRSAVGLRNDDPVSKLVPENAPPVLEQKALWNEARANLERAVRLKERNSIAAFEIEQAEATVAVSEARFRSALNGVHEKIALIGVREAELSLAQEALADTVIVAPFNGFVQQKHVSPGTYVRVGDPVVTIVRTDRLRFRGTIPERFALDLSVGQPVELKIESVPEPLTVAITRISPAVDLVSRSLLFEALIDNSEGHLRSGLFTEARVVINPTAKAVVIPDSALVEFAGAQKVWKVVNGKTREQQILTGERRKNGIQVLQGLSEGDVILKNGDQGMLARLEPVGVESGPDSSVVADTVRSRNATTSTGSAAAADSAASASADVVTNASVTESSAGAATASAVVSAKVPDNLQSLDSRADSEQAVEAGSASSAPAGP